MDVFANKWRMPNSLEEVYAKHIIGKEELKSKLGRIHIGGGAKDFSLTHNIVEVVPNNARIYLARSKNGKTNITKDIMELLMGKLTPFGKPPR